MVMINSEMAKLFLSCVCAPRGKGNTTLPAPKCMEKRAKPVAIIRMAFLKFMVRCYGVDTKKWKGKQYSL